ncbi:hypothetical protein [Rivularia sp. UHCC 0363]|uniref:hypothetical protein n=1 Tax=Rivularia sp. UHCC 0363 TaxID=3110244 RepID=UPI002B20EA91|nr:hypothetical protein [Rivularia sp. UHCC 0363]MEA5592797.1 hypothetical protein [Rivularia sp. UHCC 0363]
MTIFALPVVAFSALTKLPDAIMDLGLAAIVVLTGLASVGSETLRIRICQADVWSVVIRESNKFLITNRNPNI